MDAGNRTLRKLAATLALAAPDLKRCHNPILMSVQDTDSKHVMTLTMARTNLNWPEGAFAVRLILQSDAANPIAAEITLTLEVPERVIPK